MRFSPLKPLIPLGLFLGSLAVGYIALAWTAPNGTPPSNNVALPINVSSTPQNKAGNLYLGSASGSSPFPLKVINNGIDTSQLYVDGASALYGTTSIGTSGGSTQLCLNGDCRTGWPSSGLGGSGTASYIPKFTASGTLGNSQITDDGTNVRIGLNNPGVVLRVGSTAQAGLEYSSGSGDLYLGGDNGQAGDQFIKDSNGVIQVALQSDNPSYFTGGNVGIGTTSPQAQLSLGVSSASGMPANTNLWLTGQGLNATTPAARISIGVDTNTAYGAYIASTEYTNGIAGALIGVRQNSVDENNIFLDYSGRVGIGTTNPGQKLDVNGNINVLYGNSYIMAGQGESDYMFAESQGGATNAHTRWIFEATDDMTYDQGWEFRSRHWNYPTVPDATRMYIPGDGSAVSINEGLNISGTTNIGSSGGSTNLCLNGNCITSWPTSGTITGVTAGSNLTGGGTSGNVTIGTVTNPTFNDVYVNNGNATGAVSLVGGSSSNAGYVQWYRPDGTTRIAYLGYKDGGTNNLGLNLENGASFNINGGNVGIGTTSPAQKLDVAGSINIGAGNNLDQQNASVLRLSDNANTIVNPPSSSGNVYLNWDRGGGNTFFGNGGATAVAAIDSSGNFSANDMWVTNWFRVNGGGGIYWQLYDRGLYMADGTWIRTYKDASIWAGAGTIGTDGNFSAGYHGAAGPSGGAIFSGNVGIGTGSPSYTLDVNGTVRLSGSGLYNSSGYQLIEGDHTDWIRIGNASFTNGAAIYNNIATNGGLAVGSWGAPGAGNITATTSIKAPQFCINGDCRTKWPALATQYFISGSYNPNGVCLNRNGNSARVNYPGGASFPNATITVLEGLNGNLTNPIVSNMDSSGFTLTSGTGSGACASGVFYYVAYGD